MERTIWTYTNVTEQLTNLQTGVQEIIDLETSLKGKTGQSSRSFYESIHEPFLISLSESLENYAELLGSLVLQLSWTFAAYNNGNYIRIFLQNVNTRCKH